MYATDICFLKTFTKCFFPPLHTSETSKIPGLAKEKERATVTSQLNAPPEEPAPVHEELSRIYTDIFWVAK